MPGCVYDASLQKRELRAGLRLTTPATATTALAEDPGVLRHYDVSDHVEVVAFAHLLEDFQKYIACTGTAQERLALIAARGDEV